MDMEIQIKQYQLLEKEKAKIERQIKEKDGKIKSLESDIEFHQNEKKMLRSQIKQKDTKINSLKDEITEWNMKTDQLKLQVKEKDKKINSVQTENRSLKREKMTLGNQLKEKGDRINSLENEKAIYHTVTIKQAQKIDTLNHQKGNLERVLKSKEDAIVVLNGENKNLSAANQAINVMLGTQQNQLESKARETESIKQNLEQHLTNEKRRNEVLEHENRRLRETRQMAVQSHVGSGYYDDFLQNDINYDTEYGSDDDNILHRCRNHGG